MIPGRAMRVLVRLFFCVVGGYFVSYAVVVPDPFLETMFGMLALVAGYGALAAGAR